MKNCNCIIENSEKWIERIPDEYAIQHIEAYISPIEKENMILKFKYVKNCCGAYGAGFVQRCGILKAAHNIGEYVDGIIILQNDLSEKPSVYYKTKNIIQYAGKLSKCEIEETVYKPLEFSEIAYYSGRNNEKQKSDENAPEWLKDLGRAAKANIAYFQF